MQACAEGTGQDGRRPTGWWLNFSVNPDYREEAMLMATGLRWRLFALSHVSSQIHSIPIIVPIFQTRKLRLRTVIPSQWVTELDLNLGLGAVPRVPPLPTICIDSSVLMPSPGMFTSILLKSPIFLGAGHPKGRAASPQGLLWCPIHSISQRGLCEPTLLLGSES